MGADAKKRLLAQTISIEAIIRHYDCLYSFRCSKSPIFTTKTIDLKNANILTAALLLLLHKIPTKTLSKSRKALSSFIIPGRLMEICTLTTISASTLSRSFSGVGRAAIVENRKVPMNTMSSNKCKTSVEEKDLACILNQLSVDKNIDGSKPYLIVVCLLRTPWQTL